MISKYDIPFNKPYLTGKELDNIQKAVQLGKISGNGYFTKKCHNFFTENYGFQKVLLTTSCTDALEMAAILCDIKPGDEVIIPSYTFVSSALAFIRQGAKVVFADSSDKHPNLDVSTIESLITSKTKAIVPVHYAGNPCDMEKIMSIADKYGLFVIEDAAQAIDSYYKGKPLGSFGHFATFSFHETKNIISGEGGLLVINDKKFFNRAEIIWEKGTNRAEFFRGEADKYEWKDTGSSFLPSEITAAFLFAQLERLETIQNKRLDLWNFYYEKLAPLQENSCFTLPLKPDSTANNAHLFYIILESLEIRTQLIAYLQEQKILAVSHYLSLHKSDFYSSKHNGRELPNSDMYTNCLLRLPLFFELTKEDITTITNHIVLFFKNK